MSFVSYRRPTDAAAACFRWTDSRLGSVIGFVRFTSQWPQWLASPTAVREDPGSNRTAGGCVHRDGHCDMQPWARAAPCCSADINSALRPFGVARSSTSFGWGKGGNVTCAGWQIALCDTIWHVRSRSGEAGLLAKGESLYRIHLGLLYLLTYCNYFVRQRLLSVHATRDLAFIVCLLWR